VTAVPVAAGTVCGTAGRIGRRARSMRGAGRGRVLPRPRLVRALLGLPGHAERSSAARCLAAWRCLRLVVLAEAELLIVRAGAALLRPGVPGHMSVAIALLVLHLHHLRPGVSLLGGCTWSDSPEPPECPSYLVCGFDRTARATRRAAPGLPWTASPHQTIPAWKLAEGSLRIGSGSSARAPDTRPARHRLASCPAQNASLRACLITCMPVIGDSDAGGACGLTTREPAPMPPVQLFVIFNRIGALAKAARVIWQPSLLRKRMAPLAMVLGKARTGLHGNVGERAAAGRP
jgi:hypothetical protein